jgi:protein SCO1
MKYLLKCLCIFSLLWNLQTAYAIIQIQNTNTIYENPTQNPDQTALGKVLPMELEFYTGQNQKISLGNIIQSHEITILTLNYFKCVTMCLWQFRNLSDTLHTVLSSIKDPHNSIAIVSISFDPTDTAMESQRLASIYGSNLPIQWYFLYDPTGINSYKVAKQLNFFYEYNRDDKTYSHGAYAYFIDSNTQTVQSVLNGSVYTPLDIQLAMKHTAPIQYNSWIDTVKYFILKRWYKYNIQLGAFESRF